MELYLYSPNTSSWHGAQLKHRDKFTLFTFTTSLLSPWDKDHLEKVTVTQPVERFSAFNATQKFINVFTRAHYYFTN
jgi:hypothetical protein